MRPNKNFTGNFGCCSLVNIFWLVIAFVPVSASASSYEGIPWQPSLSSLENIDETSRYEELEPIVFSPTGRIHPIEAAVKASKAVTPLSNLVLAIRCRDGLLVISTLPTSSYLDITTGCTDIENKDNVNAATSAGNACIHSDNKSANSTVNGNFDNSSIFPSLFLFDETCLTTTTGPILAIHPCIVVATAGNAVDNKVMRSRLFALGVNAIETQGFVEEDVRVDQVARDLANQLQMVTQDLAAAQKHGFDRMIASSIVVLGNQKIFRIDPTGQFFEMVCAVLGQDADLAEEELHLRLLEECNKERELQGKKHYNVREFLESISHDEALVFAKEFLRSRLTQQLQTPPIQPMKKISAQAPHVSSQVYWQAVILDYSSDSSTRRRKPRRITRRGTFINRQIN